MKRKNVHTLVIITQNTDTLYIPFGNGDHWKPLAEGGVSGSKVGRTTQKIQWEVTCIVQEVGHQQLL